MRLTLAASMIALALPASADQNSSDTTAILKAIQGLAAQVHDLRSDVDQLKGTKAPAKNQPTSNVPAAFPSGQPPKGKLVPGWQVQVVPGEDTKAPAISQFKGPMSKFNFGLHTRYVHGGNEYAYRGKAYFHAEVDPNDPQRTFVFNLELEPVFSAYPAPNSIFNCSGQLIVNGKQIIDDATTYGGMTGDIDQKTNTGVRSKLLTGAIDLVETADYPIEFIVNCSANGYQKGAVLDSLAPYWQRNGFEITVRGPRDDIARPFDNNELFFPIRTK